MVSKLGGTVTGALSGAGTGAAIGSAIPGVGTAIGAGVGGLVGAIGGYLSPGEKDKFKQIQRLTPEQQAFQSSILQQLQGMGGAGGNLSLSNQYLQSLLKGGPQAFNQFSQPYRQQFESQTIPRLAERFAGMGGGLGGGIGGSSGFGQAIGGAGTQFESNLAQMYEQMRMQAAQQSMNQYNQLAQFGFIPSFETAYQPGTLGFGGSALPGMMQGIGQGYGQNLGFNMMNQQANPLGPTANNTIGYGYNRGGGYIAPGQTMTFGY